MPFREIAESTYDWESWIAPDGRALWINAAVARITGYDVEECMARRDYPLFLVHPEDRPAFQTVLADAREGGSGNHFEFRIQRKDGSLRWGAISWQPLTESDGTTRGYRSSVRDIDDRKRMEAALRRSAAEAEEANQAKTVFLASISHELRTPLQSILGYGELLAQGANPDATRRYADRIVSQARWLDQLVGDLLDFSSLQAGGLPLLIESCDAEEVVAQALYDFRPLFKKKGIELVWSPSGESRLRCDQRRVTQIINNLVGNALKFTQSGSVTVTSRVDLAEHEWRIVIDDTGVGVPPSRRQRIFDPFHQEDSVPAGAGLGLAITQHLAKNMGGGVQCEESPGGGARFVVTLRTDLNSDAKSQYQGESHLKRPKRNPEEVRAHRLNHPAVRVLVVDDVDPAREFLQEALNAEGSNCLAAASAKEGYEMVETIVPDLVLLDIQMPEVDGWAAARELRRRLGPNPYLIAMSASGLADDPEKLKRAGFNGFAIKPLRLSRLRELLEQARAHKEPTCSRSEEFDMERWRELEQIRTAEGDTLLARMIQRVGESLPELVLEVESLSRCEDLLALTGALHKASGLLALIGARSAYAAVAQTEDSAEASTLKADDGQVEIALDAMRRVLHELKSSRIDS